MCVCASGSLVQTTHTETLSCPDELFSPSSLKPGAIRAVLILEGAACTAGLLRLKYQCDWFWTGLDRWTTNKQPVNRCQLKDTDLINQ